MCKFTDILKREIKRVQPYLNVQHHQMGLSQNRDKPLTYCWNDENIFYFIQKRGPYEVKS